MKYLFYHDLAHGWLRVVVSELHILGIADKISSFSYQSGNYVYLEEDSDAPKFQSAYFMHTGKALETESVYQENCFIRDLQPYRGGVGV